MVQGPKRRLLHCRGKLIEADERRLDEEKKKPYLGGVRAGLYTSSESWSARLAVREPAPNVSIQN